MLNIFKSLPKSSWGEPLNVLKEPAQKSGSDKDEAKTKDELGKLQLKGETHAPFFYDYKDYQGQEDYRLELQNIEKLEYEWNFLFRVTHINDHECSCT